MSTICGIEITEEHANLIRETVKRIFDNENKREQKEEAIRFKYEFYSTMSTNPHNLFHGTIEEYIIRFLSDKQYYLDYI